MRDSVSLLLLGSGALLASFVCQVRGQGTLDALNVYGPSGLGYVVSQGVGWSFVPTADLLVTGIEASAPQVYFWQGSNQVLATFSVPDPFAYPSNNFTGITPLPLSAGQLYFVSCQNPNFSGTVLLTFWSLPGTGQPPPYGPSTFSISPYISEFASYAVSPDQVWSSTLTPPYLNTETLLYGPNFQFQVVPEPSGTAVLVLGLWLFMRFARAVEPRRTV